VRHGAALPGAPDAPPSGDRAGGDCSSSRSSASPHRSDRRCRASGSTSCGTCGAARVSERGLPLDAGWEGAPQFGKFVFVLHAGERGPAACALLLPAAGSCVYHTFSGWLEKPLRFFVTFTSTPRCSTIVGSSLQHCRFKRSICTGDVQHHQGRLELRRLAHRELSKPKQHGLHGEQKAHDR